MSEYIKREDAMGLVDISTDTDADKQYFVEQVKALPSVKVVRCKDCKYRKKVLNCSYGECMYSASMVTDNDFCSNGEVKTNEQEKWDV